MTPNRVAESLVEKTDGIPAGKPRRLSSEARLTLDFIKGGIKIIRENNLRAKDFPDNDLVGMLTQALAQEEIRRAL